MAELFIQQAKQNHDGRPTYPKGLFHFITTNTPSNDLAWDVGAGSGQAARSLVWIYRSTIATDTSTKQLQFASKFLNVRYQCTPAKMAISELEHSIAAESSLDFVTIAQAMHWFDLPAFYRQVKWILKKPSGVIAACCYTQNDVAAAPREISPAKNEVTESKNWDILASIFKTLPTVLCFLSFLSPFEFQPPKGSSSLATSRADIPCEAVGRSFREILLCRGGCKNYTTKFLAEDERLRVKFL